MPPLHDPAVDYRRQPERYRIGRGEQGALTVEPYKSELLPLWRFKTPDIARVSAEAIYDDQDKQQSADIFRAAWKRAREDPRYLELKQVHQETRRRTSRACRRSSLG